MMWNKKWQWNSQKPANNHAISNQINSICNARHLAATPVAYRASDKIIGILTRVVGSETKNDVSIVGHGDGVLARGVVELTVEQTLPVQVEGVLQVDLLDGGVGRAADTDHVERVAVQMEGMAQVGLLDCEQSDWNALVLSYAINSINLRLENDANVQNKIMQCKPVLNLITFTVKSYYTQFWPHYESFQARISLTNSN
jgi:hypothetical protein